ncbi:hypothetical protein ACFL26_00515 [Patescibacteria group bacterium]
MAKKIDIMGIDPASAKTVVLATAVLDNNGLINLVGETDLFPESLQVGPDDKGGLRTVNFRNGGLDYLKGLRLQTWGQDMWVSEIEDIEEEEEA